MSTSKKPHKPITQGTEHIFLSKIKDAIQYQERGKINEARKRLQRLLKQNPRHYLALYFLGALECAHGDIHRGEQLLRASIKIVPTHWASYNNLGNVLRLRGQLDDARQQYLRSLQFKADASEPLLNLGYLALHQQRSAEAKKYFNAALHNSGPSIKAYRGLAGVCEQEHKYAESIVWYEHVIRANPKSLAHLHEYATLLARGSSSQPVIDVYRQILQIKPDDPRALHMLAALSEDNKPLKASSAYVSEYFDAFASSFDNALQSVNYKGPTLVAAKAESILRNIKAPHVLDAGCGTGLCGRTLREFSSHLSGIDLSHGMLRRASALNVYNELHQAEVVQFMSDRHGVFDLIVSADTFCYFGDLTTLLIASSQALKRPGWIIFTTEIHADSTASFQLHPHGRFSHSSGYISSCIAEAGLHIIESSEEIIRTENNRPVAGQLVVAERSRQGVSNCCS